MKCIARLQLAYDDIEAKLAIWVLNDPTYHVQDLMNPTVVLNYVSRWPLVVHMLSACFCLGCSAMYHLLGIKSVAVKQIMSRMDYGGISVLVAGSCYPPLWYGYGCQPVFWLRNIFLGLMTGAASFCFIVTLIPKFEEPRFRAVRGYMFIVLGLSFAIPLFALKFA